MKFGIAVTTSVTPAVTGEAQGEYVRAIADLTEEAGYDSIWISDRTLFPSDLSDRYPGVDRYGGDSAVVDRFQDMVDRDSQRAEPDRRSRRSRSCHRRK